MRVGMGEHFFLWGVHFVNKILTPPPLKKNWKPPYLILSYNVLIIIFLDISTDDVMKHV